MPPVNVSSTAVIIVTIVFVVLIVFSTIQFVFLRYAVLVAGIFI